MPRHRRIVRRTMGKEGIRKSTTIVANIGQGSATVASLTIATTDVGARTTLGAATTIRDSQTNDNIANVGDIIKYINLCIQVGARWITGDVATKDDNGWLEYAIIKYNKGVDVPAVTNIGTKTLGDICTKVFRGDCLWTGCMPIGSAQPNTLDIRIKIPKVHVKMQQGSITALYFWFRSVNTADVRTDSHRIIASALYKCYV